MPDINYVTKEGLEKLKEELRILKEEKLPSVAKRIKAARDLGDISENSEYDDAKHEQAVIEAKIKELEDTIKGARISDSKNKDTIVVGSKVIVHIEGSEDEYHIVGALEANPSEKKISHESPIGSALLGKRVGDEVTVEAPIGSITYKIIQVK